MRTLLLFVARVGAVDGSLHLVTMYADFFGGVEAEPTFIAAYVDQHDVNRLDVAGNADGNAFVALTGKN
jgi:hypothetical protein